jgi:signal transduction histidine kinase
MGVGEGSAARDPPVRAELLHESERCRVTRPVFGGCTVVRKEFLGPGAERRMRYEAAILERLRGVEGVAQLLDAPRYPRSVVTADAGGRSLAGLAKPLAVDELIRLATGLARAVAGMHARGVMHGNIAPANIVVSGDGAACLVNFSWATSFADIRPEVAHHNQIVGTLAYLAPEQTGRTGRSVDQRADLYALGATLYELATGEPPFGTGDPLRLIHDHLAQVPVPPAEVNPAVPCSLSAIITHLLEKEPDNRYQSAEGLIYDLEPLRDAGERSAAGVGKRDFPIRLPPPRLVGRDDELAMLTAAMEDALAGRCRGVLVGGAPGVGKTTLVDELRPLVTGGDGWFVAGKFDQYRPDLEFDAVHQVLRALGRLLLAEPEDELAKVRARILDAVRPNAGLMAATVPEFALLLGVPPDPGSPLTSQARAQRAAVRILRAFASRERPLVLFIDDLQWAGRTPLGVVDLVLSEEQIEGLLLVGAYREGDADAAPSLAALLSRWRRQAGVRHLRLGNLPLPSLVTMVAEMLHVGRATATGLVEVIEPYTHGNPYETVELLNVLRTDGVLTAAADGWRWDVAAVRAHLGRFEVAQLPAARVEPIPAQSRRAVEAMACLGGRAELSVLRTGIAASVQAVEQALAPAFDGGLLVREAGADQAMRFRHDRIREAVVGGMDPQRRRVLQLAMARRLAAVPELFAVAAEQYLPVVDAVTDPAERRRVVELLRRSSGQAALIGNHSLVNALLTGALRLIDPGETTTLIEVRTGRHTALYSMGHLDEADEEYGVIDRLCSTALQRSEATCVQVRSLTHRNRLDEAFALGIDFLRELGIAVPAADRRSAELDHQFEFLYRWLDHTEAADDLARPDITDPALLATADMLAALMGVTYFATDLPAWTWLSMEALRIWDRYGPARALIGPMGHAAYATVSLRGDGSAGRRATQRILEVGEGRGYEPDVSQARFLCALISCWFGPIEDSVQAGRRAQEGLVASGDLAYAAYSYHPIITGLLDSAPSLDGCFAEVEASLAFTGRTGNAQAGQGYESYRWLVGVLRGHNAAGEAAPDYSGNLMALFFSHVNHAIAAAIFGDSADLVRHTAAAMPLLPAGLGLYPTALAYLLRGLALAEQARDGPVGERDGLLSELEEVTGWLAARAADAPDNFLHLLRLVDAERAWAVGDFRAAVLAFDAARREAAHRRRPWHRALIAERAARFHLAHGLEHVGYEILAQARREYLAWGATAKVDRLDWAYPTLPVEPDAPGGRPVDLQDDRSTVTSGTIDLLGIVSASQALSSQTSVEGLHSRLVQVLSAMTGATRVELLLWSEDRQDWLLPAPGGGIVPVGGTGDGLTVPMSVLRYVQRTREPLVVGDVARDARFGRDPYFTDVPCCSLLAVPILSRSTLRAVLLLENRFFRGAFTTERLEGVKHIAGQLAVSLDNAQLYAELTASRARIVAAADQTRRRIERDLHDGAQQRLVAFALRVRAAQAAVPPELGELDGELGELATEANSALQDLREISHGIHPAILAKGGLRAGLRALVRRSPVPVDLELCTERRMGEQTEISAYYVVAEALTNAAKHAHASTITVTVEAGAADTVLRVAVRDDGVGGADLARGTGLVGLKDRVEALGGHISLDSPRGAGTTLRVELPITEATAD